jgi:EmrB/QacA subfamily drug resistance transporter
MLVAGLGVFTLASVGCALAPNIGTLIAARAVQGVGAALVMPLALALLSAAVTPAQRGRALGFFISVSGAATFLGPLVGGLLAEKASWAWIFWINVPVGVVAIGLVLSRIEESTGPNRRLDMGGVVLATAGALGVVWALVRGNQVGWTSAEVLGSLAGGLVLTVAFVLWEMRAPEPILPMRFFRIRAFSAANVASFFLFASIYGMNFMLAQFLQNAQGDGPLGAGVRMMPLTAGVLIFAPVAGNLMNRLGERKLVGYGLLANGAGMAVVAAVVSPTIGYLRWLLPLFLGGAGGVMAIPAVQRAVIGAVQPQDIGKASGAVTMMRYMGGVFGIAILGAVFAAGGGYASPRDFSDGFGQAMAVNAAFAVAGAVAGLLIPRRGDAPAQPTPPRPRPAAVPRDSAGAGGVPHG